MSAPRVRPRFRSRLIAAFAGATLGALVLAGATVLVLSTARSRDTALDDLHRQAVALEPLVARGLLDSDSRPGLLRALRLQDITIVAIGPRRTAIDLPAGLEVDDLDVEALRAGEVVDGTRGSTVFVASPLRIEGGPDRPFGGALVLTRDVGTVDFGGLGPYLVVGAAIALAGGAVIGVVLARRLTRPLEATERAARAIAAGDLSARVGAGARSDAEFAEVADAFDEMAEELERSRSLTREFLMSISHDLRTPLTSIRGYAEALGAGGAATRAGERRRAAAVIESEARRLERLVSDLLDLARLDARRFTLEPEDVDIGLVVETVSAGLEPLAAQHGVALHVDARPGVVRHVDPARLGQVVANLVENAVKFASQRIDVTVVADDSGGPVTIEVRDDGPGIPPEERPRVFDRLYTSGRGDGRSVGTGLGLAITRELVTAMGGTIVADGGPAEGAVFRVEFGAPPS